MRRYLPVILFAFLAIFPAAARSKYVITVRADGKAAVSADESEAKKKAADEALRNAVSIALSSVIKDEDIKADLSPIESGIEKDPLKYILNYKVISEDWSNAPAVDTGSLALPGVPQARPEEAPPAPFTMPLIYHIRLEVSIDAEALRGYLKSIAPETGKTEYLTVKLIIIDLPDYEAFKSLRASLERVAAIRELSYNSFYRGRFSVNAKVNVDTRVLAERITKEAGPDFTAFADGKETVIIKYFSGMDLQE